jgi:hypothetical protein
MSKRTDILLQQATSLHAAVRYTKSQRDDVRDNHQATLDALNAELDDFQLERDEALARLNARLVLDGAEPLTLADLTKRLP